MVIETQSRHRKAVYRFFCLGLALVSLSACSDDEGSSGDPVACGVSGELMGQECTGIEQCGGGAENVLPVYFCDNCPVRANTAMCSAGVCAPFSTFGDIDVSPIAIPDGVAGGASFIAAAFAPINADGSRLTCEALKSGDCTLPDNYGLNVESASFSNASGIGAGFVFTIPTVLATPGEDRLVLVLITSETQGKGQILARGCAEGVSVTQDQTTAVQLTF